MVTMARLNVWAELGTFFQVFLLEIKFGARQVMLTWRHHDADRPAKNVGRQARNPPLSLPAVINGVLYLGSTVRLILIFHTSYILPESQAGLLLMYKIS